MNMILHGIEAPNIIHTDTLTENLADIQEKDRVEVVMANPPFGGQERKEVQQNFPIRAGETAFLFLQHFIKMLKAGGRVRYKTAVCLEPAVPLDLQYRSYTATRAAKCFVRFRTRSSKNPALIQSPVATDARL
jgi:hypothetical protein